MYSPHVHCLYIRSIDIRLYYSLKKNNMNIGMIALAALIPMIIGFVWYNPMVFGKTWIRVADVTDEKIKSGNMVVIFLLTYLLSFFAAFAIQGVVIHQYHIYSILANEPGFSDPKTEIGILLADFMEKYGHNFRTFKHGAFHGTLAGITFALPILAINAMFERKGFKYIAINAGFWILCLALMGGIVCQFS